MVRISSPDRGEARIYRIRHSDAGGGQTTRYRYELVGERDPLDLVGYVRSFLIPNGGPSVEDVRGAIRR